MTIVTVYTRPSCPGCTATKRRLDTLGIAFTEQPLDEDNTAAAIELGFTSAPVVCVSIDGVEQSWAGYRPDRIDAVARAA
ncbi:glutaredoxin family protein [Mycolicibacterium vanbaalenii]|uniref:glutaredoxin domain-containing protein n=1 Tax=Mycolicibacterium vanbaalenii TaxID=110539 RepID=UPI001F194DF2|nr:glutaredoxin domain-containing protein [Mycolicibacterium vanbaalenii]UJL29961.1 glutaredoxin family protein [Mycolicibacterium vanbaalenii]WND56978.1 glutaredoxin domain-containing protein [Mycolicibacterium vanbaalenii]